MSCLSESFFVRDSRKSVPKFFAQSCFAERFPSETFDFNVESSRLKEGWSCNWLSVSNLLIFDRAVMIYEIMNGLCPGKLRGRLVTRFQICNYPARNQFYIDTTRQNLGFSKSSFSTLVQRRGVKSHQKSE